MAGVGARQGVLNWTGQFLALRPSSSGQRLHSESRRSRRSGRESPSALAARYRLCDHGEVCKHVLVTETVLASAFGLALISATGRVTDGRPRAKAHLDERTLKDEAGARQRPNALGRAAAEASEASRYSLALAPIHNMLS